MTLVKGRSGKNYCKILLDYQAELLTYLEGMESFVLGCPYNHVPINGLSFEGCDVDVDLLLRHPIRIRVYASHF